MIYLHRLKVGYPSPLKELEEKPNSWRVRLVCKSKDYSSCNCFDDLRLLEGNDLKDARHSYINFLQRTNSGQPLKDMYEKKQLHEAFSFKYNNKKIKVFRIWGSGDIRIYFIYGPDRYIYILKTMIKRENKLSEGKSTEIKEIAKNLINMIDLGRVTYI